MGRISQRKRPDYKKIQNKYLETNPKNIDQKVDIDKYRENYDKIFKKKEEDKNEKK